MNFKFYIHTRTDPFDCMSDTEHYDDLLEMLSHMLKIIDSEMERVLTKKLDEIDWEKKGTWK